MYIEAKKCRACNSDHLTTTLSLGDQYLTGVFPKSKEEKITKGPLDLMWCQSCGLLQMKHSYSLTEMYGDNYGYRSGLNQSMVRHLENKIRTLEMFVQPHDYDLVIDVGSNDATSLRAYEGTFQKVGIDPTGLKFQEFYTKEISLIPDFFSKDIFLNSFPNVKAKIITSIAMFYDLEEPMTFIKDIFEVLEDDGIWHFEQSYMPSMLKTNSYDTICHEHLEFYSFAVVKNMLEKCGLRVVDVQMNAINGGSFAVTACKAQAKYASNKPVIQWLLEQEKIMALETLEPYQAFEKKVFQHRESLKNLLESLVNDGKKIIGYGASTKGNVLLQFCGLTSQHISCIAEVNKEKFGSFTPGTNIPIVTEREARAMNPDYFLVLPWHFKYDILERERDYIAKGGKFIFPLPEIEIV